MTPEDRALLLTLIDHVSALEVAPPTPDQPLPIRVERVQQLDGPPLWAVRQGSFALATDGRWEKEPLPSSRSAAFLQRCRFPTLSAAWDAATKETPR